MDYSLLYWLPVIGLLFYISFRIWGNRYPLLFRRLFIGFSFIACAALILRANILYDWYKVERDMYADEYTTIDVGDSKKECPTIIEPDEFVEILNGDIDQIAMMYNKKGFIQKHYSEDSATTYRFEYKSYRSSNTVWDDEWARIRTDSLGRIWSYYENNKVFEGFFDYLKKLGADSLDSKFYVNYDEALNGKYPIFKYKNCVFVKRGFKIVNQKYFIKVFKEELLKESKRVEKTIKNKTEKKDSTNIRIKRKGKYEIRLD